MHSSGALSSFTLCGCFHLPSPELSIFPNGNSVPLRHLSPPLAPVPTVHSVPLRHRPSSPSRPYHPLSTLCPRESDGRGDLASVDSSRIPSSPTIFDSLANRTGLVPLTLASLAQCNVKKASYITPSSPDLSPSSPAPLARALEARQRIQPGVGR